MTAFNTVRFRVKPGQEQAFVDIHRTNMNTSLPGLRKFSLIKTGERSFCIIGEWDGMASLAAARPAMIGNLDRLRPILEDLGGGLGVTDPVSGEAVLELAP
jgi:quinol monooxygenase YgiN